MFCPCINSMTNELSCTNTNENRNSGNIGGKKSEGRGPSLPYFRSKRYLWYVSTAGTNADPEPLEMCVIHITCVTLTWVILRWQLGRWRGEEGCSFCQPLISTKLHNWKPSVLGLCLRLSQPPLLRDLSTVMRQFLGQLSSEWPGGLAAIFAGRL